MDPNSTSPFNFTVPEDIWQRAMDKALTTDSWPEMDESNLVPHFFGPLEELDNENDNPYGDEDEDGVGDGPGDDELGVDDYYDTDVNTDFEPDFGMDDNPFGGFDD